MRFRPLAGSYISQQFANANEPMITEFSSPSGVLYFSISLIEFRKGKMLTFSSPSGVLYFSILLEAVKQNGYAMFSSPSGVLYFSIPSQETFLYSSLPTQFAAESFFVTFIMSLGQKKKTKSQIKSLSAQNTHKKYSLVYFI